MPRHRVCDTSAEADPRGVQRRDDQPGIDVLHGELRIDDPGSPHALFLELGDELGPALERLARADPDADVELRQLPFTFFCRRLTASLRSGLAACAITVPLQSCDDRSGTLTQGVHRLADEAIGLEIRGSAGQP